MVDAVDYYWIQAVITLDFVRQLEALKGLRDQYRATDKQLLKKRAAATFLSALAVLVGWLVWRRTWKRQVKHNRLIRQFLKRVTTSRGMPPVDVGLFELAKRSDNAAARDFARLYGQAIYRDRELTAQELAELKRLLKKMS